MSSIIAQNFDAKLHRIEWSKISREGLESIPRVHQTYLNVMPSGNAYEHEVIYSGLPAVPQVASDVVETPTVDFRISDQVRYRHLEYRYLYKYTKVAADDDQYGVLATDVVGTMGEGAAYRMEVVAADLFNNPANYTTWDGQSLFSASHTILDGASTTYANQASAAAGPTYESLQVIYSYFRRLLNDQGFYTPVEIESLQCSPELAPLWRQLLSSDAAYASLAYTSGTTLAGDLNYTPTENPGLDEMPNIYKSIGLTPDKVVENPYLTNIDNTYIVGRDKKLNMFVREAPNTDTFNIDDPKAIAHRIQMRFSVGATDARRVYLLPGS